MNNTDRLSKRHDDKHNSEQQSISVQMSEIHSGPLPHPDILMKYDTIIPGSAERILKMAEKEQGERTTLERKSTINAIIMGYLGIIFAFLSVILISGLVYYSLLKGYYTTAGVLGVGAMASVAGVFIFFRKSDKKSK